MNRGDEFFSAWEGWLEKVENARLGTPTLPEKGLSTAGRLRRSPRVVMVQTANLGELNDFAATDSRFCAMQLPAVILAPDHDFPVPELCPNHRTPWGNKG